MPVGTHDIRDLIQNGQTVEAFGEEQAFEYVRRWIEAHNRRYQDMVASLMTVTTDRDVAYGGQGNTDNMFEVNEYGAAPTQKATFAPEKVSLPLRKFQFNTGFTRDFIRRRTVGDLTRVVLNVSDADVKTLYRELRRALFVPTNYTWRDLFVDRLPLEVKRLVNGDGQAVPPFETTSFDPATHTHYLGATTWTDAAIDGAIATVREHGYTGQIRFKINAANYGNISVLPKFTAAPKDLLRYGADQTIANVGSQQGAPDDNRIIGVWDGQYYVETKPWIPVSYAFVNDVQGPRPLSLRYDPLVGNGLFLAASNESHPLRADFTERYFGIGVSERLNGAVLFVGAATYTAPAGI